MVRLFEYQGKGLLKEAGVPVPPGGIVSSVTDAEEKAEEIGDAVAIKSQIWATGRLKAGGIKFADTPEEARKAAEDLLGTTIKGYEVGDILVEKKLDIEKEFYCSMIVDDSYKVKGPKFILSSEGGVDVEQIAEETPEKISEFDVNYEKGLRPYHVAQLAHNLGLEKEIFRPLSNVGVGLYNVFKNYNARSAEINPLVMTEDGELYAADCRIAMDDASAYRHPEFDFEVPRDMARKPTEFEKIGWGIEAEDYRGVAYFTQMNPEPPEDRGNGYIAFHSIGGGGAMKSADVLMRHNFKLANYTDTSGNPTASKVYRVTRVALSQPGIEGFMMMGSTIANQDQWHHAHGFVKAIREELGDKEDFPVIMLICGNKEKESIEILKNGLEDLPIHLEVYGRDYFHKLDYLAEQMEKAIEKYREKHG